MARFGRAQPRSVFVPVQRPHSGPNNNVVTASDTLATITDVATRISHVHLTAADTLTADTDTATRLLALTRTASDTETTVTDAVTRALALLRTAADPANMLSAEDNSFEGGTTGAWTPQANCTLANSAAQAFLGTHSLAVTATGSDFYPVSGFYPVVVGQTYSGSLWVRAATTPRSLLAWIMWSHDGSTELSESDGTVAVTDTTTGWVQLTATGVAPASAVYGTIGIWDWSHAASAGEVHYVDDAYLYPGSLVGIITDAATRSSHVSLTAADSLFALGDVATVPNPVFTYLPAPPGWQPWNVPAAYQVTQWDSEVYAGNGLGEPPPLNTPILVAQVWTGRFTLKVWIPATQVEPSG